MVKLRRSDYHAIVSHALGDPLQEVCGILGGRDGRVERVIPLRNVAKDPRRRFDPHPADFLDALDGISDAGLIVQGFYHSHVLSPAYPSPTDKREWNPRDFPDAFCFICSLMNPTPKLRAFRISVERAVEEEPIEIEG